MEVKQNSAGVAYASLPSASANSGARIFVSDAGKYGHWFVSDGTYWHPVGPFVLYSSAVAEAAHTGTTSQTVIRSITIPAGIMRNNGSIHYMVTWSFTNNANNKTLQVLLGGTGGTTHSSRTVTTNASGQIEGVITNRNSVSSQVSQAASLAGVGENPGAVVTGSINTSSATTLDIAGVLASAGDSITVQRVIVLVY